LFFKVNYKKARPKKRRLTAFSRARLDRFKLFAYYLISGAFLKFIVQKTMRSGPYMLKNLIKIFDCQLYMILWRNRFYLTPFFSKRAVEAGFIRINGKTEYCSSRILQLGDVVSFNVKPLLHLRLLWMMNYFKSIESFYMLSLKTMTFIFLRYPKFKSIVRYFKMPQGAYMTNFQWF
jgi:ribosomal protein S4